MILASGLLFMAVTPLAALYAAIGFFKSPKRWKRYFPFYILTVFMIAHDTKFMVVDDITRYFEMARVISKLRLRDAFFYGMDGLFVKNIFFWLTGRIGDLQLIPSVSTTIVYGVAGYITCDTAEREDMTHSIPFFLLLQIIALPYYSLYSNVRNVCALSLVILAAYLDMVKKKSFLSVLWLYVLPAFLHQAAIFLVLFRFVAGRFRKHIYILIGAFFLLPTFIQLGYANRSLFAFGGPVGNLLVKGITKLYNYWNTEELTSYEQIVLANSGNVLQKSLMLLFVALVLVLAYYYFFYRKTDSLDRFQLFVLEIGMMALACVIFIAPHYWRFYSAFVVAATAVLIPLKKNKGKLNKGCDLVIGMLFVPAAGVFAMNARRFLLYTDTAGFAIRLLTENIFTVLFGIIWQ